jgi:hypothetical protein
MKTAPLKLFVPVGWSAFLLATSCKKEELTNPTAAASA